MNATLRQQTLARGLATAFGAFAVAYFVLWACAPVMVARAPVPATGTRNEVGAGVYGQVLPASPSGQLEAQRGGGGMVWAARRFGGLEIGGSAFAGSLNLLGGAATLRYTSDVSDALRLGIDAELGWLYGAVGVPVAYKLGPTAWVWSRPAIFGAMGNDSALGGQIPVGVAAVPTDWLVLSFEVDGLLGALPSTASGESSRTYPWGISGGMSAALRF